MIGLLQGGSADSANLRSLGPKIARGDFTPGFYVEHFVKDLGIALEEASRMGLKIRGTEYAHGLYKTLMEQGYERDGIQVLIKALEIQEHPK